MFFILIRYSEFTISPLYSPHIVASAHRLFSHHVSKGRSQDQRCTRTITLLLSSRQGQWNGLCFRESWFRAIDDEVRRGHCRRKNCKNTMQYAEKSMSSAEQRPFQKQILTNISNILVEAGTSLDNAVSFCSCPVLGDVQH